MQAEESLAFSDVWGRGRALRLTWLRLFHAYTADAQVVHKGPWDSLGSLSTTQTANAPFPQLRHEGSKSKRHCKYNVFRKQSASIPIPAQSRTPHPLRHHRFSPRRSALLPSFHPIQMASLRPHDALGILSLDHWPHLPRSLRLQHRRHQLIHLSIRHDSRGSRLICRIRILYPRPPSRLRALPYSHPTISRPKHFSLPQRRGRRIDGGRRIHRRYQFR